MKQIRDDLFIVDKDADLVYSPDDGGWYLQLYLHDKDSNTKTSEIYPSKQAALKDYNEGIIVWS